MICRSNSSYFPTWCLTVTTLLQIIDRLNVALVDTENERAAHANKIREQLAAIEKLTSKLRAVDRSSSTGDGAPSSVLELATSQLQSELAQRDVVVSELGRTVRDKERKVVELTAEKASETTRRELAEQARDRTMCTEVSLRQKLDAHKNVKQGVIMQELQSWKQGRAAVEGQQKEQLGHQLSAVRNEMLRLQSHEVELQRQNAGKDAMISSLVKEEQDLEQVGHQVNAMRKDMLRLQGREADLERQNAAKDARVSSLIKELKESRRAEKNAPLFKLSMLRARSTAAGEKADGDQFGGEYGEHINELARAEVRRQHMEASSDQEPIGLADELGVANQVAVEQTVIAANESRA